MRHLPLIVATLMFVLGSLAGRGVLIPSSHPLHVVINDTGLKCSVGCWSRTDKNTFKLSWPDIKSIPSERK